MITREEAKAWIDRIVDARVAFGEPLSYGRSEWDRIETYEPYSNKWIPVHRLQALIVALDLPIRRVYSNCEDADEIVLEYRGFLFTDYIYPKRIGKKS